MNGMDGSTGGSAAGQGLPAAPQAMQQQQQGPTTIATTTTTIPAHLMGLMTNPAFAAAAAASPLFPPAAMLSNPGAFLSMPEAFAAGVQTLQQQQQPQMDANSNRTAMIMPLAPATAAAQQQQQQPQLAAPANMMTTTNPFAKSVMAMTIPSSSTQQQPLAPAPPPPPPPEETKKSSNAQQQQQQQQQRSNNNSKVELTPEERAQQNRDRNREHARSTRLRKKAYVAKLKELVEGLHAERTEEVRQRRVAIQHLAEMQGVRRAVVRSFLNYHAAFETDERKWTTLLEDNFWLKQPVSPYRSFRRSEIEKDCRVSRGFHAVICDAASLAVMVEGIGSRSSRWMQIKRDEFTSLEESHRGAKKRPKCITRQESRLQHAISSLSSSSGSSAHANSSGEENGKQRPKMGIMLGPNTTSGDTATAAQQPAGPKVSSSSGSSNDSRPTSNKKKDSSSKQDFHDYHAQPLPDPKLGEDSPTSGEDTPEDSSSKRISTDSSSGDDSSGQARKRRKKEDGGAAAGGEAAAATTTKVGGSSNKSTSYATIAQQGGIPHNIQPAALAAAAAANNGSASLSRAPAVALPPFAGIGKRQPNVIAADVETTSSGSSSKSQPLLQQIRADYHLNEDDMILMDDVLMCPFTFRSQDAVVCGALAECVMPGMIRAHFSARNKLNSLELVYDAMGFMQQLERASGNEGTAQIIPGSLEMALAPSATEARVITLARPPFYIVNVNDVWTQTTGYTQMEVEGREYMSLLDGDGTVAAAAERANKPPYKLEEVARGRPACMTNIHYDKDGNDFIEFVCSYPLTNAYDEVTHLLHVSKELPSFH